MAETCSAGVGVDRGDDVARGGGGVCVGDGDAVAVGDAVEVTLGDGLAKGEVVGDPDTAGDGDGDAEGEAVGVGVGFFFVVVDFL